MNREKLQHVPLWAWLTLDIAALCVVALALYLDKITGREALTAATSISTCGFLAQIFSRRDPPKGGGRLSIPPSGVAVLILLLPFALGLFGPSARRA